MPLPSSGALSMSMISIELLGATQSNMSLRSLSSTAGFVTPDAISEFYGYSAVTYNILYLSAGGSTITQACQQTSAELVLYHSGSGEYPTIGQFVFTNINGTGLFNGQNMWYHMFQPFSPGNPTFESIQIGSGGLITNSGPCLI